MTIRECAEEIADFTAFHEQLNLPEYGGCPNDCNVEIPCNRCVGRFEAEITRIMGLIEQVVERPKIPNGANPKVVYIDDLTEPEEKVCVWNFIRYKENDYGLYVDCKGGDNSVLKDYCHACGGRIVEKEGK